MGDGKNYMYIILRGKCSEKSLSGLVRAGSGQQGACIPARRQELIEWLKRVVHPAIKTSPGALAAQVMRAQSAVRVSTKIDRGHSSARPAVSGGSYHVLSAYCHLRLGLQTGLFPLQAIPVRVSPVLVTRFSDGIS
jgi:hypothetical protein